MRVNVLYCSECLAGMRRLPDSSVDLILCDLPYGNTDNSWDSRLPLEPLWAAYKRVLAPSGAVVLTAQMPFGAQLIQSNPSWFRHEWIWEKPCPVGFLNANRAPLRAHENVLVFAPRGARYTPQKSFGHKPYTTKRHGATSSYGPTRLGRTHTLNVDGSRFPRSVLRFGPDLPKVHPTQKPVALFEYLIRTYTQPGEVVLDNCMGSGTTAIACLQSGRAYIGFEQNETYYAAARKRIRAWRRNASGAALRCAA